MPEDESPKYLAIKHWEKYQVIQHGKSAPWCRLYWSLMDDREFSYWGHFRRSIWIHLLMLRTRLGRNLDNDPKYLGRATDTPPEEVGNWVRGVNELIMTGFLIQTNQQDGYENSGVTPDQSRVEKRRVEKNSLPLPLSPVKRFVKPEAQELEKYMEEQGFKDPINKAASFISHYESNGWRVGRNPMKNWKAAVRTWKQNDFGGNGNGRKTDLEKLHDLFEQDRIREASGEDS